MSAANTLSASPLEGFVLRRTWAAQLGKSDRTAKRWEDAGKIVVRRLGRDPYVDLEATAARMRGEDRRRGRGV
jgi:predicted site-specific integrase-resolvase